METRQSRSMRTSGAKSTSSAGFIGSGPLSLSPIHGTQENQPQPPSIRASSVTAATLAARRTDAVARSR